MPLLENGGIIKNEGEIAAEENGIHSRKWAWMGQVAAGRKLIPHTFKSVFADDKRLDSVPQPYIKRGSTAELGGYIENSSVSGP